MSSRALQLPLVLSLVNHFVEKKAQDRLTFRLLRLVAGSVEGRYWEGKMRCLT